MAVIDDLPGVKIEITVNGEAVKEHIDNGVAEEERAVTRYIEAAAGQEFVISIELLPEFEFKGSCVGFEISINGMLVDSPMLSKTSSFRTINSKGVEVAGGMVRKYRFADLETVDGGAVNQEEVVRAKDLGTITIACTHCTFVAPADLIERAIGVNNIVSEKALKGKDTSHNVEFMDAEQMPYGESAFFDAEPVEGEPMPAALFTFRYRSLAALKSARTVPRTPSPRPPTPLEERDVESLDLEQLRELARRFKEQQETSARVKREREDEDHPPRRRTASRPSRGNTIVEMDDDGNVRERASATPTLAGWEVVELD